MNTIAATVFASLLGASTLALTASQATARIVCKEDGDCWRQREAFEYPAGVGVVAHPDDWKWKEKHAWREHEGHGYWPGEVWLGIP